MITRNHARSILFALAVLSGCASTKVTQETSIAGSGLARPNQIWVYDFIADPARVPIEAAIGAGLSAPSTPLTAEELETGRRLRSISPKAWLRISRPWVFPQCKAVRERRRKFATAYFAVT